MKTSLLRPPPPPPAKPSAAEEEQLKKAREIKQAEEKQAEQYGKAVKLFNARRFDQAFALFKEVSEGPHPTLRHRAGVHTKICRQHQQANKVLLKTAEEFYNYGIKLMNERSLDEADRHLKSALKLEPKAGHIHFARAILGALRGDRERSYESLKRAVELDPHNRYLARNDADLAGVRNDPAIAALLHEEGSSN
jgi:tetratricopeptide (TPR) repeat protein